MKLINVKTLVLLTLFVAGFTLAQAQKHGGGYHGKACNMLDLTEAQQQKIDELRTAHMKEMLPMRNELGEKRAKLQTLRTAESYNASEVNKVLEDMSAIRLKMAQSREAHRQEVRKQLNDEQRIKFDMRHANKGNKQGYKCGHGNKGAGMRTDCPDYKGERSGRSGGGR